MRIQKQVEGATQLTEETLKSLESKYFSSGKERKVGDFLLFGVLEKSPSSLELVTFNLEEYNTIYCLSENDDDTKLFPRLKLKQ